MSLFHSLHSASRLAHLCRSRPRGSIRKKPARLGLKFATKVVPLLSRKACYRLALFLGSLGASLDRSTRWQRRIDGYIATPISTVQEIKAAIKALPDGDFREVSRAVDQMEAERFDSALEDAAQSGKLGAWQGRSGSDLNI